MAGSEAGRVPQEAFIICSFASLGERLLLQAAGRSLSQNFVCVHVRLGTCYCRRPDGALKGRAQQETVATSLGVGNTSSESSAALGWPGAGDLMASAS